MVPASPSSSRRRSGTQSTSSSSARGVGSRRRVDGDGAAKSDKDRQQALTLLRTMLLLRREQDLADAWMEAWGRGSSWREAMGASLGTFDEDTEAQVKIGLARGVTNLGGDPADHGL